VVAAGTRGNTQKWGWPGRENFKVDPEGKLIISEDVPDSSATGFQAWGKKKAIQRETAISGGQVGGGE